MRILKGILLSKKYTVVLAKQAPISRKNCEMGACFHLHLIIPPGGMRCSFRHFGCGREEKAKSIMLIQSITTLKRQSIQ